MDQDATWYGGRPRPRRHCVRRWHAVWVVDSGGTKDVRGAHWRHLTITIVPSMCGGDADLCRIILTTCSELFSPQGTNVSIFKSLILNIYLDYFRNYCLFICYQSLGFKNDRTVVYFNGSRKNVHHFNDLTLAFRCYGTFDYDEGRKSRDRVWTNRRSTLKLVMGQCIFPSVCISVYGGVIALLRSLGAT